MFFISNELEKYEFEKKLFGLIDKSVRSISSKSQLLCSESVSINFLSF